MAGILPFERCATHHGNIITKYCADHDVVCCETCRVVKHRSCIHVDTLRHVGRGIKATTEYKTSKDSLDDIIVKMRVEKDLRTKNLTNVNQQKEKLLKDVDVFQDEIIAKIKDLAKLSKEQIRAKHQEYKRQLEKDEAALDTVIISTSKTLRNLSAYSEARIFANVKATEMAVQDGETLLENMSNEWCKKEIRFSFNHILKTNTVSLGHIVDGEQANEVGETGRN